MLLTQELVYDIGKRGKPTNMVLKLDMAKEYKKVSWFILMKVLRKIGFLVGHLIWVGDFSQQLLLYFIKWLGCWFDFTLLGSEAREPSFSSTLYLIF